ncbi:MAG: type I 3-dehydroquinate dehydratase [Spirochaetes bacterium]|nr:type I 3-dehydroquinate dehydratase [Spirochaetota bacterium]MBN2770500.1 type I 3-dehydroquinate dehydratase [Spirochaetota bacterium]
MSKLCVAVSEDSIEQIVRECSSADISEIRLDYASFSEKEINEIFSSAKRKLVATYRPGKVEEEFRQNMLITAVKAGAYYVDLEIENSREFNAPIIDAARLTGCKVIISYHNYQLTPDNCELNDIIDKSISYGADIVKIACLARSQKDAARLLALYQREEEMIILGMGDYGKITRVASLYLGAPFSFAAPDSGRTTAPGQLTFSQMQSIKDLIGD